jgi:hypothetical protein
MSQSLNNVPFPPPGFTFVDPKSGALAPAGTSFLRSLWARTGSSTGVIPSSQLPSGVATITYVNGAIATATGGLAPSASPAFTGDPTAPTPATGDNSTKIATTAYVQAQGYATVAYTTGAIGAAVSGLASDTYVNTQIAAAVAPLATTVALSAAIAPLAPLASPALTGAPTAPTVAPGTSTTQLATTAFVEAALPKSAAGVHALGTVASLGTGTGTVTFAVPFAVAPTVVLVSSSSSDLQVGADPASITTTGFTYSFTSRAGGSAAYSMCWRAE